MRFDDTIFTNNTLLYLSYIPCASEHGMVISDINKLEFIRTKVCKLTGSRYSDAFPISQPESFRKNIIQTIMTGNFCAALKTDGVRSMLLMTMYENSPIAVLIDRKMDCREIEIWAPRGYFDDTLYDGEIVTEESETVDRIDVFLTFDMYVNQGTSMLLDDYTTRIDSMNKSILETTSSENIECSVAEMNKVYIPSLTGMIIRPKCILPVSEVRSVWTRRLNTPHLNDGIIFTPNTTVMATTRVYKWKPLHTIDVHIFRDDTKPYINQSNQLVPQLTIHDRQKVYHLDEVRTNILVKSYFDKNIDKDFVIVECTCDISSHDNKVSFLPIRIRGDKTKPNNAYVTKETLINIKENLKFTDLVEKDKKNKKRDR